MRQLERVAQAAALVVLLMALYSALLQQPLFFATVRSGSMAPLLQRGDLALTLPVALHQPRVGDIALFQSPAGLWVVHRITGGDTERGFYTRGDANPETDQEAAGFPRVSPSAIVATVPAPGDRPLRLPLAGLASFYLQDAGDGANPLPALLLLAALLVLLWPPSARVASRGGRGLPLLPLLAVAIAGLLALFMAGQSSTIPVAGDPGTAPARATARPGGIMAGPPPRPPVMLENDAPIPLLFSLSVDGAASLSEPGWLLLGPGERGEVGALLPEGAGEGEAGPALVRVAALLPVLPPPVLHRLAGRSPWLAMALSALIPVLPLLLLDELAARFGRRPALRWPAGR